jgi:glycosyltransferase involved in cell wall biosynthesis
VRVSVIIPAYNSAPTLAACLEACLGQTRPADEIIVVDDGSTDATADIAGAFPAVCCIRQPNHGPAAARNRGAAESGGEVIVFTDADCRPAPDWLEKLVQDLPEDAAGIGGSYDMANPESLLARLVHAEILERHARMGGEVDFLGSFNVAYARTAFDAAAGFDESFRAASGEDNDLAYRLLDAGGKLYFRRDALVAHHHPEKLWSYLRTQERHGYWRMKLYAKHPGRARSGDQYAGLSALLAPLFALLMIMLLPLAVLLPAAGFYPVAAVAGYGLLLFCHGALHFPLAWRMVRRTGEKAQLAFVPLAMLRDAARAAGLVRGLWMFRIRRKGAR